MTIKISTGLRDHLLSGGSFKAAFTNCLLKIYSDPTPATPDEAPTGTLLCTISLNSTGDGLGWGDAVGGTISKEVSQVWSGINAATGQARCFRICEQGDDGASSTTKRRIQGSCGLAGADLNMSSINLTKDAPQIIDAANITMPVSA